VLRSARGFIRLTLLATGLACAAAGGLRAEEVSGRAYVGHPLIEALRDLQARGLRLVYSSDVVSEGMLVEVRPSKGEPRAVLDALLAPHSLAALEGPGGTLLIVRGAETGATGEILGVVRTLQGRQPVAAARVLVKGAAMQATTARDGTFRIVALPAGEHELLVKAPGMRSQRFGGVTVRPGGRTDVTLDLAGLPAILERIVVTTGSDPSVDGRPDSGQMLGGDEIRSRPAIGDDLHRAMSTQPGVASGDLSAEISVRGGEPNEVLVLFDGLELYDPFHLKSLQRFSGIIDTMTVGGAEYFPGGFPVEYGDRMSAVLDLSSSIPATAGRTFVSSSFINSRFMTDGTFREGAGHWLVSAREWYPDAVVQTTDREHEGLAPSYSDLLGKVQLPVGSRTVLAANFLVAGDDFEFTDRDGEESVNADSGTRYAWLGLKSLWSPRLYSRTLFSAGRIQSGRDGRIDEDTELSAAVKDQRAFDVLGLHQDWIYRPSERLLVKWGLGAKWLDGEYRYASRSVDLTGPSGHGSATGQPDRDIVLEPSGRQFDSYLSGQLRPAGPLQIEVGLRWDRQTYTGGHQVSPRVSVVHSLSPSSRLRAAWGRYYQSQGIHELQIEDGVTDFLPAQLAEQWSMGYEREFGGGLGFRADAYVKQMSSVRPRYENLFNPFELLPEFDADRVRIAPQRARARGIDLALTMDREGPFTWWAAYSRSSTEDEIDGRAVPRSWDQPHAVLFGLNLRGGDRWSAMLAGFYHTGWPTTAVYAGTVEGPGGTTAIEPVLGPRNGARYPDYHRLDLRASRHFRLGRGRLTVFAEVTNVYGRDNVCCVEDVTFVPRADGSIRVEREDGLWQQRVPSLGIAWKFDR
jgi:hypothetical protein